MSDDDYLSNSRNASCDVLNFLSLLYILLYLNHNKDFCHRTNLVTEMKRIMVVITHPLSLVSTLPTEFIIKLCCFFNQYFVTIVNLS